MILGSNLSDLIVAGATLLGTLGAGVVWVYREIQSQSKRTDRARDREITALKTQLSLYRRRDEEKDRQIAELKLKVKALLAKIDRYRIEDLP